MLKMHLRAADLAETTFCISPLQEVVFSLWVRRRPERQPYHLGWRAATEAAYDQVDREILDALVAPSSGWVPDYLTPRPNSPVATFEEELAALAALPARAVRPGIAAAYRDGPVPPVLTGRPSAVLARVVAALAEYWQACVLPSWPRMRAVLEADIVFRARQLARSGAAGLFQDLDPRVGWDDGYLVVDRMDGVVELEIAGRGLPLCPSLFLNTAVTNISPDLPPVLIYPARGRGAVWEQAPVAGDDALARLLGRPRAGLLALLGEPATTVDLARRLGVTPPAVSQHLSALRAGGLVSRARAGRQVLYLRSPLAEALLGR